MRNHLYANPCASYYGNSEMVTHCAHRMYLVMRLIMWVVGLFGKLLQFMHMMENQIWQFIQAGVFFHCLITKLPNQILNRIHT